MSLCNRRVAGGLSCDDGAYLFAKMTRLRLSVGNGKR